MTKGTVIVKDIRTGDASSNPQELSNVKRMLFFVAEDGVLGPELWKTDGAAAGTRLVKVINTAAMGS